MPIFTGRLPRIYCYSRVWIAKKWESGRKLADRNFSKNRDGARRRWRCSICSRRSPRITGISCKEVLFHLSTISRTVPGYVPRIKINSRIYVCVCRPARLRPIHPFPELFLIYHARYPPPPTPWISWKTANPRETKRQAGGSKLPISLPIFSFSL